jgi:hypothetical protein
MSEPGGWTTPEGWGPPTPPPAPGSEQPPASYGQQYGQQQYGQPAYGQQPYGGWRPDVKPGVVPLRPLGLGELLDGAVGVLRRYPRPTLGMSAVVAVVSAVVNVVLLLTAFRPFVDVDSAAALQTGNVDALESALGGAAVGFLLTAVLTVLSGAVLTGVLTAVVGKAVLGQPLTLGQVWAQVRPALPRLVLLAFALAGVIGGLVVVGLVLGVLVAVLGGPVLLVVGIPLMLGGIAVGSYLYVRLSLAPCALVLEQVGIGTSLRRSWLLVKGDWWRVFGISLLTLVVAVFVSLVIQVPFELLGYGSLSDLTSGTDALSTRALIASAIGGIVSATLVDPFTSAVRALLYVDRRMRAEGLDVALTAAAARNP